jgi:hypothetical protein
MNTTDYTTITISRSFNDELVFLAKKINKSKSEILKMGFAKLKEDQKKTMGELADEVWKDFNKNYKLPESEKLKLSDLDVSEAYFN